MHELAKEGKAERIEFLLKNDKIVDCIGRALLIKDKLGWTPLMSATKADKNVQKIIDMFLNFLLNHKFNQLEDFLEATPLPPPTTDSNDSGKMIDYCSETIFTLLMRKDYQETFSQTRNLLFQLIAKHSSAQDLSKWFYRLTKQLLKSKSCPLNDRSMKELILLASNIEVDFKSVLSARNKFGNTILMKLALEMKDEALHELMTNTKTSKEVCTTG